MNAPRSVVIVGAGLAGSRCAETLRAEGYDGSLVVLGAEPIAPYERPALSKEFLVGERDADSLSLRPPSFWAERGIELRLGDAVTRIDAKTRSVVTAGGTTLRWDALVAATGARPRRLPFAAPEGVQTLRTLADATALRGRLVRGSKLVVIGGGFVGAEVASTASSLGVEVTMLDRAAAPFAHVLGGELARTLGDRFRGHGIDLRPCTTVVGFRLQNGAVEAVVLADGSAVRCDTALVAIGAERSVEVLPTGPVPGIHVCGDAAGGHGHWTAAAQSGANAARSLLGLEPLPAQPPFVWSDQFGLRLQLVGDPARAASVELEGDPAGFVARYRAPSGQLVGAVAGNRPRAVAALRQELAMAA